MTSDNIFWSTILGSGDFTALAQAEQFGPDTVSLLLRFEDERFNPPPVLHNGWWLVSVRWSTSNPAAYETDCRVFYSFLVTHFAANVPPVR